MTSYNLGLAANILTIAYTYVGFLRLLNVSAWLKNNGLISTVAYQSVFLSALKISKSKSASSPSSRWRVGFLDVSPGFKPQVTHLSKFLAKSLNLQVKKNYMNNVSKICHSESSLNCRFRRSCIKLTQKT